MSARHRFACICLSLAAIVDWAWSAFAAEATSRPNIVFILADDLGYGDLGCFGQRKIRTPCIDQLAVEGTRFTQAYCGTSVCAPSRCALMTGMHSGHGAIRGNREIQPEGQQPLPAGTYTAARMLKDAGYATGCIGKWGLGFWGSGSDPLECGFDSFFGYDCQRKAHEYYPEYLWRNGKKVELAGTQYSHDLLEAEALDWLRKHADRRFFLFLPLTIPHGKYQVPDVSPYGDKPWTEQEKTYAAMVTRLDTTVGRVLDLLRAAKLDEQTLVIFASDNGSALDPTQGMGKFFETCAGLRGFKRSMYEGGLRVPAIARWTGRVPAGKVIDAPWAFWDFLPTCAQLVGAELPSDLHCDGRSIVGLLTGGAPPERECFYWELHEGKPTRFRQAVRFGDWKAVRNGPGAPLELYELKSDPHEEHDLAAQRPQEVARAERLLEQEHRDSPDWPILPSKKPPAKTQAAKPS